MTVPTSGHDVRVAPAGPDAHGAVAPPSPDATAAAPAAEGARAVPRRRRDVAVVVGVTAIVALPIVVALVAVRRPTWYPLVDLAQIEMRVRDVGPAHPPVVGLGGRIFGLGEQGAHPGPAAFYLLAPVYRLLGSSSWALQASNAVLDVAALALTVWAGLRRWGVVGAVAVGATAAFALRMWGTTVLLYPWNPYLPVLFWLLFLVCAWGVLCGDLPLLPVAAVAGTVCAQTHLPYVGLVAGMSAVLAVSLAAQFRRASARRRIAAWTAASVALAVVAWVPVVVEQAGGHPGNVSIIVDSLRHPTGAVVGLRSAATLLLEHLDPAALLGGDRSRRGNAALGAAVLAAWAVAAVVAVRRRDDVLVRLHVVVGAALALGLAAVSRIAGVPWFYLLLWAYGTAALTVLATVATYAAVGADVLQARTRHAPRVAAATLAALLVVPTALLTIDAPDTHDTDVAESEQLGRVVPGTVGAIADGTVPGGRDGTYLVTWTDPVYLGGQGLGLLLELERRGYRARGAPSVRLNVRDHRVVDPADADAEIHVATGLAAIAEAEDHPGARRIAGDDPRTPDEVAAYERRRADVIDELRAHGLDDLVPEVDRNLFGLANDDRVPSDLHDEIDRMWRTPPPVAVFTWDPTT